MLYVHGVVSSKPWEPIFSVRGRPAWVQTTVFDLLKQLKALRLASPTLPSIDTLSLPSHRHIGVSFGDLDALSDSIVSAHCCPAPDQTGCISETKITRNSSSIIAVRSVLPMVVQMTEVRCGSSSTRYASSVDAREKKV